MFFFNRLMAILVAGALLGFTTPVEARTKKGDRFLAQGRIHEEKKEWDAALEQYEKALSEDPTDIGYQMAAQRSRFEAAAAHVTNATKVRQQGQLAEALIEFQKAYAINPSSTVAEQEVIRTQDMILAERRRIEQTGKESSPTERGMTPAEKARKDLDERVERMQGIPQLRPIKPNLIDFKMYNTPRILWETVAKYAQLNIVWDTEYSQQQQGANNKLTVDFDNTTIEQAFDYLAVITKSYWKPLSSNTIFVTVDTPNKRRDYEEEVTKIFYLTNATSQQDLTDMVTAVRTVADCNRLFPYNSQNAIIAKCTTDRMALAEKIIHDLDKARAEVVVDIYVIEANSTFTRTIATGLATTGLNVPFSFSPRPKIQVQANSSQNNSSSTSSTNGTTATTTTNTSSSSSTSGTFIPLSSLGHLASSDYATTLPTAVLQATLSDTRSKVLQSPQMRSVDGQKATLKIGEKVPYASGSFGSTIGGIGQVGNTQFGPGIQTSFTQLEVGVNVEVTPHVHDNGEISLLVNLEVSNVTGSKNFGGLDEPIIGQKKIDFAIRLKEGEVSLLGGLLSLQDSKTKTGIPGLSSIPLFGRLFSSDGIDRERDELMIAMVPHVVRRPQITASNLREVASGNQTVFHVTYGPSLQADGPSAPPAKEEPAPAAANPAAAAAGVPVGGTPVVTAPAAAVPTPAAPANAAPAGMVPVVPPPTAAAPGLMPPATAPPDGPIAVPASNTPTLGSATFRFDVNQVEKNVNDTFAVTLMVSGAKDVAASPMQFQFDPKVVSLTDVNRGGFWTSGGKEPILTKDSRNDTGSAAIRISAKPEAGTISGSGALVTLTFKAVGKGSTNISVSSLTLQNPQGQLLATGSPQVTVNVK